MDTHDNGLWHLTVYLSHSRGLAFLTNIANDDDELKILMDESWEAHGQELLEKFENAVYSHPQVLDDYSAHIVVCTPDTVWIPSSLQYDDTAMENLYSEINSQDDSTGLFHETDDDVMSVTSGIAGLVPFLSRTFPGARVSSREMVLLRKFRKYPGGGTRLYATIERDEMIISLLNGQKLLCSSTFQASSSGDRMYVIAHILNCYHLDPSTMEIFVAGDAVPSSELIGLLREKVDCVMHTPSLPCFDIDIPLSARIVCRGTKSVS